MVSMQNAVQIDHPQPLNGAFHNININKQLQLAPKSPRIAQKRILANLRSQPGQRFESLGTPHGRPA